jgi:hypothetical protein
MKAMTLSLLLACCCEGAAPPALKSDPYAPALRYAPTPVSDPTVDPPSYTFQQAVHRYSSLPKSTVSSRPSQNHRQGD